MAIRTIQFESDLKTQTKVVLDIREFDMPANPTPRTWTELTKDLDRRVLIMDLMRQIDDLATGRVDEIHIFKR